MKIKSTIMLILGLTMISLAVFAQDIEQPNPPQIRNQNDNQNPQRFQRQTTILPSFLSALLLPSQEQIVNEAEDLLLTRYQLQQLPGIYETSKNQSQNATTQLMEQNKAVRDALLADAFDKNAVTTSLQTALMSEKNLALINLETYIAFRKIFTPAQLEMLRIINREPQQRQFQMGQNYRPNNNPQGDNNPPIRNFQFVQPTPNILSTVALPSTQMMVRPDNPYKLTEIQTQQINELLMSSRRDTRLLNGRTRELEMKIKEAVLADTLDKTQVANLVEQAVQTEKLAALHSINLWETFRTILTEEQFALLKEQLNNPQPGFRNRTNPGGDNGNRNDGTNPPQDNPQGPPNDF